jgi:hypothetical protein
VIYSPVRASEPRVAKKNSGAYFTPTAYRKHSQFNLAPDSGQAPKFCKPARTHAGRFPAMKRL